MENINFARKDIRSGENFYVTTSPSCENPKRPFWLGAYFALKPPPGLARSSSSLSSVIATFGGEIRTDTFGFGAIVDSVAQILTAGLRYSRPAMGYRTRHL